MVDLTSIAAVTTSLKAAGEIAHAAIGLSQAEAIRGKVLDMQTKISAALGDAVSAYTDQLALLERVRGLESKVAELEAWDREKARYQLTDVNVGRGSVYAYTIKPDAQGAEPAHCICAKCYEDGKKSVLQGTPEIRMRLRVHLCPRCKTEYVYSYQQPQPGAQFPTTIRS